MSSWDIFFAHASADKARVRPLVLALRALGLRVFFDEDSVPLGEAWDLFIPRAQRQSRATVACLSSAYMAAFYERAEVHDAIRLHRQGGHMLVPLHLDLAPGEDDIFYGLNILQGLNLASLGVEEVARRIASALGAAPPASAPAPPPSPELVRPAALYEALCRLTEVSFEELLFKSDLKRSHLLPSTASLSSRAINLIEHASETPGGYNALVELLRRLRPGIV